MAVDSEAKRMSALGTTFQSPVFPIPDGTISTGDRLDAGFYYRAFEPEAPAAAPAATENNPLRGGVGKRITFQLKREKWPRQAKSFGFGNRRRR